MIHARKDYNRIQDPEGKIEKDEPVFLIRAKDRLFVPTVLCYTVLCYIANFLTGRIHWQVPYSLLVHCTKAIRWQHMINKDIRLPDMPFDPNLNEHMLENK